MPKEKIVYSTEYDCPMCGKHFLVTLNKLYTYKIGNPPTYLCGWNCYRKFKRLNGLIKSEENNDERRENL